MPVFRSWDKKKNKKTVRALSVRSLKCYFDIYSDIFITWSLQTDIPDNTCYNSARLAGSRKACPGRELRGLRLLTAFSLNIFHRESDHGWSWKKWRPLQGADSVLPVEITDTYHWLSVRWSAFSPYTLTKNFYLSAKSLKKSPQDILDKWEDFARPYWRARITYIEKCHQGSFPFLKLNL